MFKNNITLVKRCMVNSINTSHHAAVILIITLNAKKGKTLWKLNNALLQDKDFIDKTKKY